MASLGRAGRLWACAQSRGAGPEIHPTHKIHTGDFHRLPLSASQRAHGMCSVLMLISQIRNRTPRISNPVISHS